MDGHKLDFHLAGINNENFIMKDDETGSWWQQVTGEAIQGPLKGHRLNSVPYDELSFSTWKRLQPRGRVLRPDERFAGLYAPANWEEDIATLPVVTPGSGEYSLAPRTLVVGITVKGDSKAYPIEKLKRQTPFLDTISGVPLLLVMDETRTSIRAFERTVDNRTLEFYEKTGALPLRLLDVETGSEWDFAGKAVSGPLAGRRLQRVSLLTEYWFDWKTYHPDTGIY